MATPDIQVLWKEALSGTSCRQELRLLNQAGTNLSQLINFSNVHCLDTFRSQVEREDLTALGIRVCSKSRSRFKALLKAIHQFAPALDVFVQQQSVFVTLAWGTARLLLQVCMSHVVLTDRIQDLLCGFLRNLDLYKSEASLSLSDRRVVKAIKDLFTSIIVLLASTIQHFRRSKATRLLKAPFSTSIEDCAATLEKAVTYLERVLSTVAREAQHHHQNRVERTQNLTGGHVLETLRLNQQILKGQWADRVKQASMYDCSILPGCRHQDSGGPPGGEDLQMANFLLPVQKIPELTLVAGTCQWLLRSQTWLDWTTAAQSKLLIITGCMGSGKTAHATACLAHLSTENSSYPRKVVLSYFFSQARYNCHRSLKQFLTNLICQSYEQTGGPERTKIVSILHQYRHNYQCLEQCPNDILQTLLDRILDVAPPFALLIDGLDECMGNRDVVINILVRLSTKQGTLVVATCRSLGFLPSHTQNVVNIELLAGHTHHDFKAFVQDKIGDQLNWPGAQGKALQQQVFQFVLKQSQDNFLHAGLVVEILRQKRTPAQVKVAMENFTFDGVDDLNDRYHVLNAFIEKTLTPEELSRRTSIFRLLVATQEPLNIHQINDFLALDTISCVIDENEVSFNIKDEIEHLGQYFICISNTEQVTFYHTAAKLFFLEHLIDIEESNLFLARKCLAVLSQNTYRDPKRAVELLRRHLLTGTTYGSQSEACLVHESPIYEYAAKHFHEHIVLVSVPPEDLVAKLGRFLRATEFVSWSEALFDFKRGAGFSSRILVYKTLMRWSQSLPVDDQEEIAIQDYFEIPHLLLAESLKDTEEDKILQYLPRIRVGEYFNAGGQCTDDWRKACRNKEIVAVGLSQLRGPTDPFVMKARSSLYAELFWQKQFTNARDKLTELYRQQKDIVGMAKDDIYVTAWLLTSAYLALGQIQDASELLHNALKQVRERFGNHYRLFMLLELLDGQRLELNRHLDESAAHYRTVVEALSNLIGSENGFTLLAKTALGAVLRKQGQYDQAETYLFAGWAGRQKLFGSNINVAVDAALQLAMLYRDRAKGSESIQILDELSSSEIFQEDFERKCQETHIRCLVAFDQGEYVRPKRDLLELLEASSGSNRDRNNRELLWVRIDLADVMRMHGDDDEAWMLFSDLVTWGGTSDSSDDLREEPESPAQLKIAEKALRLVREAKIAESKKLLEENKLRWVCDADFWFLVQGGPTLDTSIISPVHL